VQLGALVGDGLSVGSSDAEKLLRPAGQGAATGDPFTDFVTFWSAG
jgi:hypothetical protein